MVTVVERQDAALRGERREPATRASGWPLVLGTASIGAGAIHAAAIGGHDEHRQAVVLFTVVAALQIGAGVAALLRPRAIAVALAAVVNGGALAGWVLAKTNGIPAVDGLGEVEAVQTADALAAALALGVLLAAAAWWARIGERSAERAPLRLGGLALVVAAAALPGMITAGTHSHSGGAHDDGAHSGDVHDDAGGHEAQELSTVPPRPYDPNLPIDLGGVEGVTPQQQAAAENLVAVTLLRLPQFADPEAIEAMGFVSIGDGGLGHEHYLNAANMADDRILDPDYPESLVFDTRVTPKRLAAAMFMLNPGDTLDDVPELGGKLTQWHVHDNLCFSGPRVAGLTDSAGACAPGLTKGAETPMIHVWIEPHPCGPFAALDGIAGGTIPAGEQRLCDHAHGSGA